ncbi:MAG: glycosyltransferase family 4 protein [Thermoplasmata archaeon]
MRILRLIPYFSEFFGGPVNHVRMLTEELDRLGHDTVLYTTDLANKDGQTRSFDENGKTVRAFPVRWRMGEYFYTPQMRASLEREDFDIVHAHCYRNYQADIAAWISRKTGKPLVFTAHGTLVRMASLKDRLIKRFYDLVSRRAVLQQSSRVIALSQQEIDQYCSHGVSDTRIVQIYHGIDESTFSPAPDGNGMRKELGLGSRPVVLYAGRIHERKGLQHLLPAFREVLKECPQAVLVVCGPDYGYRGVLERIVRGLSISKNVVFMGQVEHDRMPAVYNSCDVVVLPAAYEVFGHVLAEAAACGKPIVATEWGWAAEFFENEKDALLIGRYGDVTGLTNAILTLLRDPGLRDRLGRAAHEKVLHRLSWKDCATEHLRTYEHLLNAA